MADRMAVESVKALERYAYLAVEMLTRPTSLLTGPARVAQLVHRRPLNVLVRVSIFFFQAEDGIRDYKVTGVQTCALPIYGIQRISLLSNVLVLSGAGVGGGSLVYANTLYRPPPSYYHDPQWTDITDWSGELARWYDQAERMLGVGTYARTTRADEAMRKVAERMGVGDTFHPTPVGVYFGQSGVDPYFGGAGPARNSCTHCGSCMTGCRFNAKNTLVKNYLYLAEKLRVEVFPRHTVTEIRPGWTVRTRNGRSPPTRWYSRPG